MKQTWWIGGALLVTVGLFAAASLFQPWLLWVDETVSEELPDVDVSGQSTEASGGRSTGVSGGQQSAGQGPTVAAKGRLIDAEHATSGKVQILSYPDGRRFLRFVGLDTSNGPDLHVWLTDRESGGGCSGCQDSWGIYDDSRFVKLGALKANRGDQNYPIPKEADLTGLTSAVIWCDRFDVAFGTADISRR